MKDVVFEHCSYEELNIPKNSLIYCDIPYRNTKQYIYKFDYEKFYDWCREMKNKGHIVFVSEYECPNDFECVWSMPIKDTLNNNKTFHKTEKTAKQTVKRLCEKYPQFNYLIVQIDEFYDRKRNKQSECMLRKDFNTEPIGELRITSNCGDIGFEVLEEKNITPRVENLSFVCGLPLTPIEVGEDVNIEYVTENVCFHISRELFKDVLPKAGMLIRDKKTNNVCKILIEKDEKFSIANIESGNVTCDLSLNSIIKDFLPLRMELVITDVFKWLDDNYVFHNLRHVDMDGYVSNNLEELSKAFKLDFTLPMLKDQDFQFILYLRDIILNRENFKAKMGLERKMIEHRINV